MECPSCGYENADQAKFCGDCAQSLAASQVCDACGTENPPRQKFCNECANPLSPAPARSAASETERSPREYTPRHLADKILQSKAALEGERKHVTVLFADVKSSLELAEQLDPEEWHEILNRFFEILTEGVHRFEGNVNQYTGDGIMALFGAPIAHEDHAYRACYAALYLRDSLTAYTDQLRVERGLNFSVRIGINSGEVVVGKIGDDLRMDYTAQGHTVGLAQRMESLAEPGKALLAGSTIDIVEGFFTLRDLGEMQVKGVEQPVRVAELADVGQMRTRLDRSRARGLSKFVGREEDMQLLESALERSLEGDGQVVGVVAEAGTGKSRLCFEFLERCRARRIAIRSSTGVPHGHAVPMEPVLEFYREIFGVVRDDDDAQTRQKIAGSIAQLAPEELDSLPLLFDFMRVPDPAQLSPQHSAEEREQALMALLRRLTAARSRREPAVLVFEDLHWLDPQTESVIEWIIDATAGTRTLFIVNFRPEFRADWMSRTHYQQIALRPLSAGAAGELLSEWLGPDPSLAGYPERVRDRTGGNPFFMEEVVQAQIEAGALVGTRGRFRLMPDQGAIDVPASVQALLAARIDRLEEETKRLLQTASVIGDEMAELLLADVSELIFDSLRGHLRQLVQGEFLYEASLYPELGYAFKHPLTREVAYKSLLSERRRAVHAQVAARLEARAGEAAPAQAALLAHHWEEAERPFEAARWQGVAAERMGGANTAATLYHWSKVIELLAAAEDSPEARALRGQARAQLVYAASRSARSEEEVAELFAEAQRDLGNEDSSELALALIFYAIARSGAGALDEAQMLSQRALEMARRVEAPNLLAFVLASGCIVANAWEQPDRVCAGAQEVEALCVDDASLGGNFTLTRPLLLARAVELQALRALGRGSETEEVAAKLEPMLTGSENPMEHTLVHWALAQHRLEVGDVAAGLEHSRQSVEWALKSTNEVMWVVAHFSRGVAFHRSGRLDDALEHLERAREIAVDRGVGRHLGALLYPALFDVERERGNDGAALAWAEQGLELITSMGSESGTVNLLTCRAELDIETGTPDALARAESMLARCDELLMSHANRSLAARVLRTRSLLANARGDREAHERLFREAAALHERCGETWLAERSASSSRRATTR